MAYPLLLNLLAQYDNTIIYLDKNFMVTRIQGDNNFSTYIPIQTRRLLWEQIPPDLQNSLKTAFQLSATKTIESPLAYQFSNKNGLFSFKIFFEQTKSETILIIHEERLEQDLELELQRSEARFRSVIESADQGILLVNVHGRITLVNSAIEHIFGYERDELLDAPIEILLPPMYKEIHNYARSGYLSNPLPRSMAPDKEVVGRHKNGDDIPIEVSLTPIELYDGIHIIAFVTDISERNRLQNKIRRIEKLEAIGQLAGGIAHDFNNVLAGIIGLTELAIRKLPENSDAEANLKMVINKAQSAADLVKQLLAFSRQQVLRKRPLNFNSIINTNKKMLQRYLGEDIVLKTELDPELHLVNADSSAMDQIITNLCINARDAMPDGGELIIKTENVDLTNENISLADVQETMDIIKITIRDSGIGMRKEVQKHIFEPFYSTKEFGQGTGLGLSTVYGLIEQHNGQITVESIPGEGSSFYIFLPAFNGAQTDHQNISTTSVPLHGTETVLVVDDEDAIIRSISETLSSYGYTVLTAENGIKALELFEENSEDIDLVISDLIMPERGGMELKMLIQSQHPQVRFLHITGFSDRIDANTPHLKKPFLAKDLLQKIRELLD